MLHATDEDVRSETRFEDGGIEGTVSDLADLSTYLSARYSTHFAGEAPLRAPESPWSAARSGAARGGFAAESGAMSPRLADSGPGAPQEHRWPHPAPAPFAHAFATPERNATATVYLSPRSSVHPHCAVSPAGEQLREKLRNAEAREEAIRDAIVSEHAELRRTLQRQALRMGVDARAASTGVAVDAAAASVEESAAALVVAAEGVDLSGASVAAAEATMIQAAEGVEESAAALVVAAEGVEESAEATTIQAAEGVDSSAASVAAAEATMIQAAEGVEESAAALVVAAEGVEESAEATTIQAAEGVDSSAASVAAAEATTIQAAAARAAAAQLRAAIDAAHAEIEDTNAEILAISARTEVSTLTTAIKAARAEIDAQAARALQSEKTIRSLQGECSFMYRYILRESCSQFDSLPLTSLTNLFNSVVVKSGIVCPKALEKNFIAPLCVKLAQLGGLTHVINDLGAACMGNKTTVEYVC